MSYGSITTSYTVWCRKCSNWDHAPSAPKDKCIAFWIRRGWKKNKAHGWLCPSCAKEKKDE